MAVPPPHDEARVGGVEAVAQAHSVRGDVHGEVLAVALAVAAPDWDDDELRDDKDREGDEGGDEERLRFVVLAACNESSYGCCSRLERTFVTSADGPMVARDPDDRD